MNAEVSIVAWSSSELKRERVEGDLSDEALRKLGFVFFMFFSHQKGINLNLLLF